MIHRAVYKIEITSSMKWLDIENKIYNEQFRKSYYLFGIRIFRREVDIVNEIEESEKKSMGFAKKS